MIIKEINNSNNYCIVHGVIHANTRQYEICDYCLKHKRWMYPRTVYYRHGFAKKDVLMCDDCHEIERKCYGSRLTTTITENNAYESICQSIREKSFFLPHNQETQEQEQPEENGNVGAMNYYDAVRIAYQNSRDVREYLRCAKKDINKDLQIIWKFTYRILNFERRVKVVNKDDVDNLLVSWADK
jgi:hypothetical protein